MGPTWQQSPQSARAPSTPPPCSCLPPVSPRVSLSRMCSHAGNAASWFSHGLFWVTFAVHRLHIHHGKVRLALIPEAEPSPGQGAVWGSASVHHKAGALGGGDRFILSSSKPKGHRFDSRSGHMPRLLVQSPVGAHIRGNQSMFLSHIDVSLPSFPFHSLSKINKCVLR